LESGHSAARRYPLATVWTEAGIIRERRADRCRLDAAVMQLCIASVITKEAGKELQRFIAGLTACD